MKQIVDSIRKVLRNDPLLVALVGIDGNDEVRVYDEVAKSDTQPPFVMWAILPGGDGLGTYGEKYSINVVNTQIACWHKELKRAWQLSDAVEDAVEKGDYDAGQYQFMQVRRLAFPQPLPDRDTSWFQVALSLQFQFSGPGVTQ